jgi:hypothetical protein
VFELGHPLLVGGRPIARITGVLHLGDLIVEAIDLILQRVDLLAVGGDDAPQIRLGIRLLIIRWHYAPAKRERADQHQQGQQKTHARRPSIATAMRGASTH